MIHHSTIRRAGSKPQTQTRSDEERKSLTPAPKSVNEGKTLHKVNQHTNAMMVKCLKMSLIILVWPSDKVSLSRAEGSRLETRFPLRLVVNVDLVHTKSELWAKSPPSGVVPKFGERGRLEVPAQVSSSS
ncbi:hypothetical protein AVEN_191851-1 [Araneus ventricosus]|uniref:Uncharacterized protein n=1 Tax=Araneus ventricosus TaxID=182803 RepID=A0A4Y2F0R5_ARAVE|nr:hypothetical protein AVEN_191851-1 [Araneus ventricosus]